ncbi:MAG TPA: flagellar assembly protein FliW [Planctomycetota bacterium]|jgi:flagellar assembly factor FliW|nr:flagellar assembly protein FliW [Planctomycetota bacterium]OQC19513.1 MAG: Flagellar assembly factor FliW [Planctomycetes bacterium ADurb.Bin069]NMD36162.1 flagellar assembly protein FliW [Planctomycetota bacterium]HNR99883.1 flagellar assembly protein FliW [Planctomycetota bacterium]HNU26399.1 flagellar assembly protein FliW [Planctomycetota bacterium]
MDGAGCFHSAGGEPAAAGRDAGLVKLATARFGEVAAREDDIVFFPRGLLGFPDIARYAVIARPEDGPFRRLQAVERLDLSFVIADPLIFFPRYRLPAAAEQLRLIDLTVPADGIVAALFTVPRDPRLITANLQAPIVFNTRAHLAMQLILSAPEYTAAHRVFTKEEVPQGA